ncbi:outer membrane lipoprotein carrier protein LolA [Reyranella sp.]|uniref:outer membrane lipoprotein carrier protein LolA n=1 Tax=Reyranella sp. TaxID=1929291 RepID=UPI003782D4DD
MRIFLTAVLATILLALGASLPAQAQTGVPELEKYINSIRTMKARFVQSNPNGSVVQGNLYVRRPGRMRFEYDAPSQLKIVADGYQVTMWDPATRDFGQWPIGWTAASFLVKDPLSLSGDLRVEKIDRVNGLLEFTMFQTRKPKEGKVIVRLAENPLVLRGWTIIDERGHQVTVSLNDTQTNVQLADSLFKNDSPDPASIRRQPN